MPKETKSIQGTGKIRRNYAAPPTLEFTGEADGSIWLDIPTPQMTSVGVQLELANAGELYHHLHDHLEANGYFI